MHRIIYPNNNTISIIIPIENINLHTLAKSLVPINIPYKIINLDELLYDRTFRNAWTYNFDNPDGIGENNDNN